MWMKALPSSLLLFELFAGAVSGLLAQAAPAGIAGASSAAQGSQTFSTVSQAVQVLAGTSVNAVQPDDAISTPITADQVASTAGAFSDIPRFLQTLPGIQFDSDTRNTYLVNGGNPLENLVVVNGVEIPNINHISSANTSGGFVSMLDTDAVSGIRLHKMLYSPAYSGSLSSVLAIRTKEPKELGLHGDVSVGYAGADVVLERPLGVNASGLFEFRKSVVSYFTDDIGIDGSPTYWSTLSTIDWKPTSRDSFSTLYLQGVDGLTIKPNLYDPGDPGLVNTFYTGNRFSLAETWNRSSSEVVKQQAQFSYSRVRSSSLQTDTANPNTVEDQNTLLDQPAALRYDFAADSSHLAFIAGGRASVNALRYQINQVNGLKSPYEVSPTPLDASNINRNLHPVDAGLYSELTYRGWRGIEVSGGAREQQFGLNHRAILSPRLSVRTPTFAGASLYAGLAKYAQLAPLPIVLGIASNDRLRPIRNLQMQAGLIWQLPDESRITLSVYRKLYYDYPVSSEHPTLTLANIVDAFGQPTVYMPMVSSGKGVTNGAEIEYASNPAWRFFVQANVSTQHVLHRALDGVARRTNFDMPFLANVAGGIRLTQHQRVSVRDSYHTGTPYTPYLVLASNQQTRPIYDLSQINTQRGPDYARLDLRYEIERPIRSGMVELYGGLDNVLDRRNFYQYVMIPRCSVICGPYELTQQGRFAEVGIWYRF